AAIGVPLVQAEQPLVAHEPVLVGDDQRDVPGGADRVLPGRVLVGVGEVAERGQQYRGGWVANAVACRRAPIWPVAGRWAAAGRADDQRHHVLVLAGLQPDAVDAARPAG